MYERSAPDPKWTGELVWWFDWCDRNFGECLGDDGQAELQAAVAYAKLWRLAAVHHPQDEDDLDDLLDRAWGTA